MTTQPGFPDPKCIGGLIPANHDGSTGYFCAHPSHHPERTEAECKSMMEKIKEANTPDEPAVNEGPYPIQTGNATVDNVNRVRNEAFREGVASCQEKIKVTIDLMVGIAEEIQHMARNNPGGYLEPGEYDELDESPEDATVQNASVINFKCQELLALLKTFGRGGAK